MLAGSENGRPSLTRRICAFVEAGVKDRKTIPRPNEEPLREANGMFRLDKGVSHLDGVHNLQQLGVVRFDEADELIGQNAVLHRLVVVHLRRPAFASERVDVCLDERPIPIQ